MRDIQGAILEHSHVLKALDITVTVIFCIVTVTVIFCIVTTLCREVFHAKFSISNEAVLKN